MRRREFIVLFSSVTSAVLGSVVASVTTKAQQRTGIVKVGFLYPGSAEAANLRIPLIREGLRVAGDQNEPGVDIVSLVADGNPDRLPALATEMLGKNVDVIIAVSPSAVRAARAATDKIPIVAVDLETDPVASGWISSLAQPGGNVTGLFLDFPDFSAKCLQLLMESVPGLTRVGVLWDPATGHRHLNSVEAAAAPLGVKLRIVEVTRIADLEKALQDISAERAGGVVLLSSPIFIGSPQLVADLALKNRLPSITLFPEIAQRGGMLAYGPDLPGLYRQAAVLSRKLLRGARPADVPVERPTRLQLVVNLKTATALGLTIGPSLLARADEVIE
jgi:putative tryptophan/tyrosine transport system substrate-binding protein